jgi:hypothetical protein
MLKTLLGALLLTVAFVTFPARDADVPYLVSAEADLEFEVALCEMSTATMHALQPRPRSVMSTPRLLDEELIQSVKKASGTLRRHIKKVAA